MKELLQMYHSAMTRVVYYSRLDPITQDEAQYVRSQLNEAEAALAEAELKLKKFRESAKNNNK